MTELAQRYRIFSGLLFFDIDKEIEKTPRENLPKLYLKLIWNIQRGIRLSPESRLGKEFAWLVCNLAVRCNIDTDVEDITQDGLITYDDERIRLDLEFAHNVITDCEHLETIINYLIGDNSEEVSYILEESEGKLILDKI